MLILCTDLFCKQRNEIAKGTLLQNACKYLKHLLRSIICIKLIYLLQLSDENVKEHRKGQKALLSKADF